MVGAVIAVPGTVAYIAAKSNTILNTFTAPHYTPDDTSVEIQVQKIVHNVGTERIGPKGFQFVLVGENNEQHDLVVDRYGHASVVLPFGEADLGKTFIYHLYEVNDGRANVIYDRTVYEISIVVALDEANNAVTATVTVDDQAVEPVFTFENTYAAKSAVPLTGDRMNIALCVCLMLASAAGMLLLGRRKAKQ